MTIIQFTPCLPPRINGITHYAIEIAKAQHKALDIDTLFISIEPKAGSEGPRKVNIDDIFFGYELPDFNPEILSAILPQKIDGIIIQVGYSRLHPMLDALDSIRALGTEEYRVVSMIHELELPLRLRVNSIAKKMFDIESWRPYAARRKLVGESDAIVTNTSKFKSKLEGWTQMPVRLLPTFSNMGEIKLKRQLCDRSRSLIVFGTASTRQKAYENCIDRIRLICDRFDLDTVIDVGPGLDNLDLSIKGIQFVQKGLLSVEEIGELFSNSFAGFIDYTQYSGLISKSGVFAAYCAYNMLIFSAKHLNAEADNLFSNQHYLVPETDTSLPLDDLQTIADCAQNWYSQHSLMKCGDTFSNLLFSSLQK